MKHDVNLPSKAAADNIKYLFERKITKMKKNSLRSAVAALAVAAVSVSAASMNAFAAPEAASLGFTDEQILASADKPYVTLTKQVLTLDEVKANNNKVTVSMSVTGAQRKYAATGFHVHYDSRLEVATDEFGLAITPGAAISRISPSGPVDDPTASEQGMKGFFVCSSGNANNGIDGVMWDAQMILPNDAKAGDVYGFDIYYIESKVNEDLFVNTEKDEVGNIMQAWTFTRGIYNELWNPNFAADPADVARCAALANISNTYDGYIAIADAPVTTTTTTVVTTTTTTENVPVVTTTTTTAAVTTSTGKPVTTQKPVTTKKPSTTKKPTTTKPAGNAPQTGVAGVGVAVAGLAVALGTAFVLRKKED